MWPLQLERGGLLLYTTCPTTVVSSSSYSFSQPYCPLKAGMMPTCWVSSLALASGKLVIWVFQGNWVHVVGRVSSLVDKESKEHDKD